MRFKFEVDLKPSRKRPQVKPKIDRKRIPTIRRTLVLAHQIAEYMKLHNVRTFVAFRSRAQVSATRMTQIMNLLYLSPKIQEEILTEEKHPFLRLRESDLVPLFKVPSWRRQEELWNTWKALLTNRERWLATV